MFASLFVLRSLLMGALALGADLAQIASLFVGRRAKRVAKRASQHVRGAGNRVRERVRRLRNRPKPPVGLGERFTDAADWVSSAMGTPANILLWFVAVAGWFLLFALNPSLQNSNFMPAWFTSLPFNLPLNLITTLAELFIGFLVAAASNRIERRNHQQMERLDHMERQMVRMEREHGEQIKAIHELLTQLHAHTQCTGHTVIVSPADTAAPAEKESS